MKRSYIRKAIRISTFDADVAVILPNGQEVTVQWRSENETIDVLLDQPMNAYVHPDDDLGRPKRGSGTKDGSWLAKQIVLIP